MGCNHQLVLGGCNNHCVFFSWWLFFYGFDPMGFITIWESVTLIFFQPSKKSKSNSYTLSSCSYFYITVNFLGPDLTPFFFNISARKVVPTVGFREMFRGFQPKIWIGIPTQKIIAWKPTSHKKQSLQLCLFAWWFFYGLDPITDDYLGGGLKGKIPILTNIFQRGWNHQIEIHRHFSSPFFVRVCSLERLWQKTSHRLSKSKSKIVEKNTAYVLGGSAAVFRKWWNRCHGVFRKSSVFVGDFSIQKWFGENTPCSRVH